MYSNRCDARKEYKNLTYICNIRIMPYFRITLFLELRPTASSSQFTASLSPPQVKERSLIQLKKKIIRLTSNNYTLKLISLRQLAGDGGRA